jgi:hypothetical protein
MPYSPIGVRCRVRDDGGAAPTGSALFVCPPFCVVAIDAD